MSLEGYDSYESNKKDIDLTKDNEIQKNAAGILSIIGGNIQLENKNTEGIKSINGYFYKTGNIPKEKYNIDITLTGTPSNKFLSINQIIQGKSINFQLQFNSENKCTKITKNQETMENIKAIQNALKNINLALTTDQQTIGPTEIKKNRKQIKKNKKNKSKKRR